MRPEAIQPGLVVHPVGDLPKIIRFWARKFSAFEGPRK